MDLKTILGAASFLISFGALVIYLNNVYFGRVRPHLFTWLVWSLAAGIVAAGQYAKGAGSGMWLTAGICFFSFLRVIAAVTHGERRITRGDWICLGLCLAALALWPLLEDPVYSVSLLTVLDFAAFLPTFRKSWRKPEEEDATSFFLFGCSMTCSMLAIENYNLTTLIYPAVGAASCWAFWVMLLLRRRACA
jgi:hypothetical protein